MFFGKKKYSNNYSNVTVDGKTIRVQGSSITVINDKIIVDGRVLDESMNTPNITVIIEGDCKILSACGNVEVKGNAYNIDCRGSCHIKGNVKGNVSASGSVTCGDAGGDVDASGSVKCVRR